MKFIAIAFCLLTSAAEAGAMGLEARYGWGDGLASPVEGEWTESLRDAYAFWNSKSKLHWNGTPEGQFNFDDEAEWTRQRVLPIFGGKALIEPVLDPNAARDRAKGRGFSIRYFDNSRDRWVMANHWPSDSNLEIEIFVGRHEIVSFPGIRWSGAVRFADGKVNTARLTAGQLLDGCAIAAIIEQDDGPRTFSATSYSPRLARWISYTLDDQPGTGHRYRWSSDVGSGAIFYEAPSLPASGEFEPSRTSEFFDADAALRRTVWRTITSEAIIFEEQLRSNQDNAWMTNATYTLEKKNGDT